MVITVAFDLKAYQRDTVNVFTKCLLDETVYCEYPEFFQSGKKVTYATLSTL